MRAAGPCEQDPDHPDCGPVIDCNDPTHPDHPCQPPVDCNDPTHPGHPCEVPTPRKFPTPTRIDTGAGGSVTDFSGNSGMRVALAAVASLGIALGAAATSRRRAAAGQQDAQA